MDGISTVHIAPTNAIGSAISGSAIPEITPSMLTDSEFEKPATISLAGKITVDADERSVAVIEVIADGRAISKNVWQSGRHRDGKASLPFQKSQK